MRKSPIRVKNLIRDHNFEFHFSIKILSFLKKKSLLSSFVILISTNLHACNFSTSTWTLDSRIFIVKLALERIRYVVANTFRTVEYPGEILALVFDAREVLRGFNVYPVARFICRARAIAKE